MIKAEWKTETPKESITALCVSDGYDAEYFGDEKYIIATFWPERKEGSEFDSEARWTYGKQQTECNVTKYIPLNEVLSLIDQVNTSEELKQNVCKQCGYSPIEVHEVHTYCPGCKTGFF